MDTEPDTDSDSEDEDVEFVPVSRPDQVPRTPCKSAAEFFAEDSPVPASGHPRAGGRAAAAASGGGAGAQGGGGWGGIDTPWSRGPSHSDKGGDTRRPGVRSLC